MKKNIIYKEDCYYQTFLDNEFENTNFIKSLIKEQDSDPNTVVTIIHHTDLDGIIAAQLTKEYCHNVLAIYNVKLIAYNYNRNYDFKSKILPNSKFVFIVDLSPNFTTLSDIQYPCCKLRKENEGNTDGTANGCKDTVRYDAAEISCFSRKKGI
jgi:hypothetical protein